MKKVLIVGALALVFIGCGETTQSVNTSTPVTSQKVSQVKEKVSQAKEKVSKVAEKLPNVKEKSTKVVKTAKKLLDPCERNKVACIADCKLQYIGEDNNLKRKACIAKCYTIYTGCKTAKIAKKGYQVTKEAVKKGYEKTKEFIQEHTN